MNTDRGINKIESFREFRQYFAWRNQTGIRREISHDAHILFLTFIILMLVAFGLGITSIFLPIIEPVDDSLGQITTILVFFMLGGMWGIAIAIRLLAELIKEHGFKLSYQPSRARHWLHAFYLTSRNEEQPKQGPLTKTDKGNRFVWQHKFQMAGFVSGFYLLWTILTVAELPPKIVGIIAVAVILAGLVIWDRVYHRETKGSTE